MTKNENIWNLYDSLNKSGSRGEVQRAIASACGRASTTVKNHWFKDRHVPEEFQDVVISILQIAIKKENDEIKEIEVKAEKL